MEAHTIIELTRKRGDDRPWWDELEWLQAKGYTNLASTGSIRGGPRTRLHTLRASPDGIPGFTIPAIVNRSYASSDMCEHWLEFWKVPSSSTWPRQPDSRIVVATSNCLGRPLSDMPGNHGRDPRI